MVNKNLTYPTMWHKKRWVRGSSLAIFSGVLLNKSIPKYLVNIGLFGGEDG
jgi:hypothetical protein